jgi:hypothetical protein
VQYLVFVIEHLLHCVIILDWGRNVNISLTHILVFSLSSLKFVHINLSQNEQVLLSGLCHYEIIHLFFELFALLVPED